MLHTTNCWNKIKFTSRKLHQKFDNKHIYRIFQYRECMENIHVLLIIARDFIYFTSIYFRVNKFGMNLKRLFAHCADCSSADASALFFMQTSKHINIDLSIHRYIKCLHKSLRGGSFCLLHNKLKGLQFWFTLCVFWTRVVWQFGCFCKHLLRKQVFLLCLWRKKIIFV